MIGKKRPRLGEVEVKSALGKASAQGGIKRN